MTDRIETLLLQEGYHKISSSLAEFTIFYMIRNSQAEVVHLVDLHEGMNLTIPQYQHIREQILTMFEKKGYPYVRIFSLFVTPNAEAARSLCTLDSMGWIVESSTGRLIIYEGQMSDFYGLKVKLEQLLITDNKKYSEQDPYSNQNINQEANRYANQYANRNTKENRAKRQNESYWKTVKQKGWVLSNATPVNTIFVLINIIVFIALEIIGDTTQAWFMAEHGAIYAPYVFFRHENYRLFTCMWLHFGIRHLLSNMLALFFLGDNVERAMGKINYIFIYIGGGMFASMVSCYYSYKTGHPTVSAGASGAIFSVVGALLVIVIANKGRLEDMTTARILLLIGYSLFSGLTSQGIDNAAHIGGLIAGVVLSAIFYCRDYEGEKVD